MKRLIFLFSLLIMTVSAVRAETAAFTGHVRENLPALSIAVTQSGAFDENAYRPYELTADISAADGSLGQEIVWRSNETPAFERAAALVMLMDFNFDGYQDLQLLTAAGARNVFYSFALWNPLKGRFDPVTELDGWVLVWAAGTGAEMRPDAEGVTGYIWHSFLEETAK